MPVFDFLNDVELVRQRVERRESPHGGRSPSTRTADVKVWESQAPAPSLAEVAMMCQAVPQRWLSSAMYYRRRLEFIHAEFCLDNLLDALPNAQDDLNVIFHYGDTLKELGKFTEAETWFLRGVARSPEQPLFRQQLVDVMKELKRDPVDILKHAEAIPDDETLQEEAEELRREIARSQQSEADEGGGS